MGRVVGAARGRAMWRGGGAVGEVAVYDVFWSSLSLCLSILLALRRGEAAGRPRWSPLWSSSGIEARPLGM